jgi:hypothetical protein
MTTLLEQAVSRLRSLSEPAQDAIAALILEELEDERRWDEAFERSQPELTRLAAKVREDIKAGRTSDQGFDDL